jgi:hypothetical protein
VYLYEKRFTSAITGKKLSKLQEKKNKKINTFVTITCTALNGPQIYQQKSLPGLRGTIVVDLWSVLRPVKEFVKIDPSRSPRPVFVFPSRPIQVPVTGTVGPL